MRDKFRTTLASIPKSKSGDVHVDNYRGEWKYFKSLQFLQDQFTPRKSTGNFPKENEDISNALSQMSQDETDADDVSQQTIGNEIIQSSPETLKHPDTPLSSGAVKDNVTPSSSEPQVLLNNIPKSAHQSKI